MKTHRRLNILVFIVVVDITTASEANHEPTQNLLKAQNHLQNIPEYKMHHMTRDALKMKDSLLGTGIVFMKFRFVIGFRLNKYIIIKLLYH